VQRRAQARKAKIFMSRIALKEPHRSEHDIRTILLFIANIYTKRLRSRKLARAAYVD